MSHRFTQCASVDFVFFQIYSVDLNDSEDCAKKFRSNKNLGLMFWFFIMAGTWLKIEQPTDKDTECVESLS